VRYAAAKNSTPSSRTATITVGGSVVTVSQGGAKR
jgi:hypothetical protein